MLSMVTSDNWTLVNRAGDNALGVEPGWYWGRLVGWSGVGPEVEDAHGPFPTAADACMAMVRMWVNKGVGS